jgi:hypothetical protein
MDLLELNLVPETVPAEEGRGVGDLPLLDEAVAVVVRRRPDTLLHVRRSDQSKYAFLKLNRKKFEQKIEEKKKVRDLDATG